ncbi:MAG: adenylyltransferase [Thermoproteota archaeon]|nr:MAG: adenylyltransferase [Candidatus Korarchaeota archaeon]RLG55369.1 MAG: adenylyltransferase [Candidatus Korarchaeota archaeon]
MLSERELVRYGRQLLVSKLGKDGQLKLKRARVAVIGVGGLGCTSSLYLALAGVGKLLIVDSDRVELSNLNRQILHWTKDIGRLKVESAAEKLREVNPEIEVEAVAARVTEENAHELIKEADLVVDGLDNFKTRFLVNDACVEQGKPFVHAAVHGLEGRLMTILPGESPCLRCLLPAEPPEVKPIPVLGATAGVMGCLEAMEAVKVIAGVGKPAVGRLIVVDGLAMAVEEVRVERRPDCPACSRRQQP